MNLQAFQVPVSAAASSLSSYGGGVVSVLAKGHDQAKNLFRPEIIAAENPISPPTSRSFISTPLERINPFELRQSTLNTQLGYSLPYSVLSSTSQTAREILSSTAPRHRHAARQFSTSFNSKLNPFDTSNTLLRSSKTFKGLSHTSFSSSGRSFSLFPGGSSITTGLPMSEREAIAEFKSLLRDTSRNNRGAKEVVQYFEKNGWDVKSGLVHSDEAFSLYLSALSKMGLMHEVAQAVRKRDDLIGGVEPQVARQPSAPYPSSSSSSGSSNGKSLWEENTNQLQQFPTNNPPPTHNYRQWNSPPPPNRDQFNQFYNPLGDKFTGTVLGPLGAISNSQNAASSNEALGSKTNPLAVQMAGGGQSTVFQVFKLVFSTLVNMIFIATIAAVVLDRAGYMKDGKKHNQFSASDSSTPVTFTDVQGVDEAKEELKEVVEFLKDPEKFGNLGGKLSKGVLLTGPPGTGKTMLARAVAGEAGVPFFYASASEFDEMWVGSGSKAVRELFKDAKEHSPAIVFIDEIDAVGGKRTGKDTQYSKQTLNQLLVEMDGFSPSSGVIVIGATNFPEGLDKALVRPGRFDRHVVVPLPDVRGRVAILKHHMRDVLVAPEVDPTSIARGTPGMSGAELENLVNQAAIKASREGEKFVSLGHFEWAKDRIMMGAERKSHIITPESKRLTAYHEGGHALVALHTPGSMPLHKVTVLPRGQALGITFQLPDMDKDSWTKQEYLARIDVAMGGRVAEEMIYGKENITSGAHSDLQAATGVATAMVTEMGYSDKVGLVSHSREEQVYLSERKKDEIESEIRSMLDAAAARAHTLLKTHRASLDKLASALIRYETLSAEEVRDVLKGKRLTRDEFEAAKGLSVDSKLV